MRECVILISSAVFPSGMPLLTSFPLCVSHTPPTSSPTASQVKLLSCILSQHVMYAPSIELKKFHCHSLLTFFIIGLLMLKRPILGCWWASLVAQRLKRLPAVKEIWVRSLGREDPWRRKWQPTPVFLPEESHGLRSLVGYSPRGRKECDTTDLTFFLSFFLSLAVDTVVSTNIIWVGVGKPFRVPLRHGGTFFLLSLQKCWLTLGSNLIIVYFINVFKITLFGCATL